VDQSSQVDQFDHCTECGRPLVGRAGSLFGQQQQGGPEQFALHLKEVRVDLGDQAKIRFHDATKLLLDLLEPGPERKLELSQ
jgi:hypothetical protein